MRIKLSDHFTYRRLVRLVMPSILMMIFTSIYSLVDGLFVSNFVGKTAFAAINLIIPVLMIMSTVGFMIGTGGSALVAKALGEKDRARANRYFSMFVYTILITGVGFFLIGQLFVGRIAQLLGAEGELLRLTVRYARINFCSLPFFMLQIAFQSFYNSSEKPKLGLMMTVIAGLSNMALDAVFVAGLGWGLEGAALATTLCETVGGIAPLIYYGRKNDSLLKLGRTKFEGKVLLKACTNGASEFMTNISMSVVTVLYNLQLIKIAGEDGVSALGTILYINFIFAAIFIGYSLGLSAVVSYNYGAGNHDELRNVFGKSIKMIAAAGIVLFAAAEIAARPLAAIFVGYDKGLMEMTIGGFRIFSISFLIFGINIFSSGFFTALSNGIVSAAISFMRTLVFQVAAIMILPVFFGLTGVWLANVAAEALALIVSMSFLVRKRKIYHYA